MHSQIRIGVILFLVGMMAFEMQGYGVTNKKIRATEEDSTIPYDPIGMMEVKIRADLPSSRLYPAGERYKRILRSKLAAKAAADYKADSVIKVEYWPDPSQGNFSDGHVYGRGEMIRFRKFPSPEEAPVPAR